MTHTYRLVREVEGQHEAVVKQRLGVVLKVDGERLDALFTGKAVTVRNWPTPIRLPNFRWFKRRAAARRADRSAAGGRSGGASSGRCCERSSFKLAPAGTLLHDRHRACTRADRHLPSDAGGARHRLEQSRQVGVVALDLSHLVARLGADLHDEMPEPDTPWSPRHRGNCEAGTACAAEAARKTEADMDAVFRRCRRARGSP
jgi:hypothetical protein